MPAQAWFCDFFPYYYVHIVFVVQKASLQLLSLLHPSEYTGMTNSETRFGIHILFFSVPSLRKRWFRSRSTRSSRRRRGNPQLSPRESFSQTCGVAPRSRPRCEGRTANPKTPNGCAQPPPRSDAQLPPRSGTTGATSILESGCACGVGLGPTAPAPTTVRASRPGCPGDGDNRLAPSTQEKSRPHKGKIPNSCIDEWYAK